MRVPWEPQKLTENQYSPSRKPPVDLARLFEGFMHVFKNWRAPIEMYGDGMMTRGHIDYGRGDGEKRLIFGEV